MRCFHQTSIARRGLTLIQSPVAGRRCCHDQSHLWTAQLLKQNHLLQKTAPGHGRHRTIRTQAGKDDFLKGINPQHRDDVARVVEQAQRAANQWTTICTGRVPGQSNIQHFRWKCRIGCQMTCEPHQAIMCMHAGVPALLNLNLNQMISCAQISTLHRWSRTP